jgi:PAS domain S-box-containing protein
VGEQTRTAGLTGNIEVLFQLKGVGVVQTDLETGRFVRANRAFCEMVGYSEADLQALSYEELTHPDDRVRDAANFAAFQRGELDGSDAITRVLRRDGAVVWLELHVSILHEAGRTYNVAVAHDVTERKRAEEARRESEVQSRTILESITDAFFAVNRNWRFTYVNKQTEKVLGRSSGDLLGKVIWEAYPGLVGTEFEATYRRAANEQVASSTTAFYPDHNRWYEVHAYPAADGITVYFRNVTERMRIEEALRESEARYRTLFNSIDEGFCVIEMLFDATGTPVDYRFLEANPMFEQQTGLVQVVGQRVLELVPDLEAHWFERYGRVASTGEPLRFINRSVPMNRWFDVYAFRLGDDGSRKVALLFSDITARKQAEETLQNFNATLEQQVEKRTQELRRSEQRFSQAFNAGPVAACITTLDASTVLEVNAAFSRLTGYGQDEAAGKTHQELGLWSSPENQTKLKQERNVGNDIHDLELQIHTKAGEVRNIMLSAGVIDLDGKRAYLEMFYDITSRKKAEAERELLRQAMDNAGEVVVITTAELDLPGPQITYVNAAFTSMTGYQAAEVIGQTPRMFQGPKTDRAVLRRMRRRLKAGQIFQGESVNYRKDGSAYVLAWNIAPIYDAKGRITHWVSTQHDVTERRALEREILDISALEQRRIASELHDSVQQLLVGTAMQAKALARVLSERGDEQAKGAEQLYASVQDSVNSVRAVLAGITPIQENENGLMVALESLCQRITGLFGTPCSFSFERPLLMTDFERATQLYHVAQEAVINAARHAEASRVEVRLSGNGLAHVLTVFDDGKGLNEQVLHRQGSTGLGLMEYRAKLIGARLEVTSAPGQGTTVSCSFDV